MASGDVTANLSVLEEYINPYGKQRFGQEGARFPQAPGNTRRYTRWVRRGKGMKGEWPSTRDSTASALPGLFNVSQRDAASNDGQQSGFDIRASKRTCVPRGNGRGKGKHEEEQLGVGAAVSYMS